ncbi:MAG: SCO1664 family protein [Actinomycetota bacterium]|nr:SCO1664 family protein [Actinomycetota bacterium]
MSGAKHRHAPTEVRGLRGAGGGARTAGDDAGTLALLSEGKIELKGRIAWSSNATFLVEVRAGGGDRSLAIYKPTKGERPLWDFPRGLWKREVAAYELARWLGWDLVPPTVGRADGPFGPGSLQYWVDAVEDEHYFTLLDKPQHLRALRRVAVFDLVVNNADRKGGHCLLGPDGHIWAIDHGLCFHTDTKLRTVIWDFAGEQIEDNLLDALEPLAEGQVPDGVSRLLEAGELGALAGRARTLRRRRKYPAPTSQWPYPWPLL